MHGASGFAIHVEVRNGPKEFDLKSPKVMWWRLVGNYPNYLLVQFGAWSYITQRKTFEHSIKVGDRNSFCFLQSHRRNVPPETALSKYAWSPWSPISVLTGRTSLCCFLLLLRPGDHQLGSLSMDRGISGNWDQAMGNRAKRKHWLFSTPETWLVWLVWLVINQNFFCEENCAWSHTLQKKSWFRSSGPHGFSWVCSSSHWILWKIWKVPWRDSVGKIQLCRIHIHERLLLYKNLKYI